MRFCNISLWLISWAFPVKLPSSESYRTSAMICQLGFRYCLVSVRQFVSVRQQSNTWANVDQVLCCHIMSPRANELRVNSIESADTYELYWTGLSYIPHQAITWMNDDSLSIAPFTKIWIPVKKTFFEWNTFENVIFRMVAILLRGLWVIICGVPSVASALWSATLELSPGSCRDPPGPELASKK